MSKKKKSAPKEPSWDDIGKMVGKKVEKEFKDKDMKCWHKEWHKEDGQGFAGRLLFIIGVVVALNTLGVLHGIAWWVYALIIVGFALLRF